MSADSRRDPLRISGTIIADKYRIEHAVGEGGFSVVYKAEHTIWQQPVAIKCFQVLSNAPEDQRRELLDGFIQEGKLMAQLSSRSAAIVQARDVGNFITESGQWMPFMVLEWLEGKPLDVVLWEERRANMPARSLHEVLALLDPAAAALEIAHQRGIAHRDIKPANFFVLGDPRGAGVQIKVLDFGIAKVMADHASAVAALAHTGKDITSFTPNYGAPEQFSRTHGATGPWTDVFAMALILVEILRGGIPALEGSEFMQLAFASRDPARRPTPRTFGVEISDAVEHVFRTALAVNPAERYASMGQFWAALMHAVFPDAPTWAASSAPGASTQPGGMAGSSQVFAAPGTAPFGPRSIPGAPPTSPPGTTPYTPNPTPPRPNATTPLASQLTAQTGPQVSATSQPYGPSTSIPVDAPARPVPADAKKGPSGATTAAVAALAVIVLGGGAFAAYKVVGGPKPAGSASATPITSAPVMSASAPASASAAPRPTECPAGMVLVPGGKFFMGSDDPKFKLWQPAHKVVLDTFCIDVNEVTAGDYKACSDVGECKRPPDLPDIPKTDGEADAYHDKLVTASAELCNFGKEGRENHPINCVSWPLADQYCKVKKKRLPTEAEWEYAARGSDGRKFPWGDEPAGKDHMNAGGLEYSKWETSKGLKPTPRMYDHDDGFVGTAPVGSFPKGKTKYGANDFVGNVWEWTADYFETYKAEDEVVNPKGAPAGEKKAIRGGGFNGGVPLWLNPAFRYFQLVNASAPGIGFRCAMSL
jgi:formylglycine-generating enzyme required for sulfatase activity